jgi:transposase-like protein
MERLPRGKYTKEFREEAVKLVTEEKFSWVEAAKRLSLPTSTLANWFKASKAGKLGEIG